MVGWTCLTVEFLRRFGSPQTTYITSPGGRFILSARPKNIFASSGSFHGPFDMDGWSVLESQETQSTCTSSETRNGPYPRPETTLSSAII